MDRFRSPGLIPAAFSAGLAAIGAVALLGLAAPLARSVTAPVMLTASAGLARTSAPLVRVRYLQPRMRLRLVCNGRQLATGALGTAAFRRCLDESGRI